MFCVNDRTEALRGIYFNSCLESCRVIINNLYGRHKKKHKLLCFTATPCFHCRLPFYYELKIAFVVWLLSPYTKGSSVLYRKFVHPTLSSKEKVKSLSFLLLYLPLFPLVQLKERLRGQNVQSRL